MNEKVRRFITKTQHPDATCPVCDTMLWHRYRERNENPRILLAVHDGTLFLVPVCSRECMTKSFEDPSNLCSLSLYHEQMSDMVHYQFNGALNATCYYCETREPKHIVELDAATDAFKNEIRRASIETVMAMFSGDSDERILAATSMSGGFYYRLEEGFDSIRSDEIESNTAIEKMVTHVLPIVYETSMEVISTLFSRDHSNRTEPASISRINNVKENVPFVLSLSVYKTMCAVIEQMRPICTECANGLMRDGNIRLSYRHDPHALEHLPSWVSHLSANPRAYCTYPIWTSYVENYGLSYCFINALIASARDIETRDMDRPVCWRCGVLVKTEVVTRHSARETLISIKRLFPSYVLDSSATTLAKGITSPNGDGWLCSSCFAESCVRCGACGKWFCEDYGTKKRLPIAKNGHGIDTYLCENCTSIHCVIHPKSDILFGLEFEVIQRDLAPGDEDGLDQRAYQACDGYAFGESIKRLVSRHFHIRNGGQPFCITHDGSIDGRNGIELVTYPMNLEDIKTFLRTLTESFRRAGATSNYTCGVHVHIGGDLSWYDAAMLYEFCVAYEHLFFGLFPTRASSRFCLPMSIAYKLRELRSGKLRELSKQAFLDAVVDCSQPRNKTIASAYSMYDKYRPRGQCIGNHNRIGNARYSWANFYSYLYRKTVEIRIHPGSVDGAEIYSWVSLWNWIVRGLRKKGRSFIGSADTADTIRNYRSYFTYERSKTCKMIAPFSSATTLFQATSHTSM